MFISKTIFQQAKKLVIVVTGFTILIVGIDVG